MSNFTVDNFDNYYDCCYYSAMNINSYINQYSYYRPENTGVFEF